jgi:hypothetical protein
MVRRALLLALALTVMVPSVALAGGPGKWTRVTGEDSWFELNLQRAGGLLHMSVREDESASTYRLIHRSITAAGVVGASHTVASGFEYLGYYPGVISAGAGVLRILFGAKDNADGLPNSSMLYVDSTDNGETWSAPAQTNVTGGSAQDPSQMDAVVHAPSGVSYQVWEGTLCICVQRGLGPQNTHTNFNDVGGNNMDASIAYDHATEKVWVSWLVFGDDVDGIYVREVNTTNGEPAGPSTLVPGSFDTYSGDRLINFQNGRVPMIERRGVWGGGGGVYVAYRKGYPSADRVNVWKIGDASPVTVAKTGKGVGEVAVAADQASRMWVVWASDGKIFARRSDRQGERWGKTVKVKAPPESVGVSTLQADAQKGKLDVLAYASRVNGSGFFHTQLRPGISFSASPSRFRGKTTVVFTTKDAGAPLSRSKVTAGGKSCKTDSDGRCSIVLGPYSSAKNLKAKATHSGYVPSTLTLRALS